MANKSAIHTHPTQPGTRRCMRACMCAMACLRSRVARPTV
jgi:hypothetical protein